MNKKLFIFFTLLVCYQTKSQDIFSLIQQKNYQGVNQLLDQSNVNINQTNVIDDTPLTVAIKNNDIPMVHLLLKFNPNVNHVNFRSRKTPLILAAEVGNPIIVEKLLEAGVDINKVDRSGENALIKAINNNNTQLVELLIRHGAKLPSSPSQGVDLIRKALQNKDADMLWNLIAAGANIKGIFSIEGLNEWHKKPQTCRPIVPINDLDRIFFTLFLLREQLNKIISGQQENYNDPTLSKILNGVDERGEGRFIEPILKSFVTEYANQKIKEFGANSYEGERAQKILDNINQINLSSSGAAAASSSS